MIHESILNLWNTFVQCLFIRLFALILHDVVEEIRNLLVKMLIEKFEIFLDHKLLDWVHVLVQDQVIISRSVLVLIQLILESQTLCACILDHLWFHLVFIQDWVFHRLADWWLGQQFGVKILQVLYIILHLCFIKKTLVELQSFFILSWHVIAKICKNSLQTRKPILKLEHNLNNNLEWKRGDEKYCQFILSQCDREQKENHQLNEVNWHKVVEWDLGSEISFGLIVLWIDNGQVVFVEEVLDCEIEGANNGDDRIDETVQHYDDVHDQVEC